VTPQPGETAAVRPAIFSRGHILCLVTDRRLCGADQLVGRVEAALRGGVGAVQLREKDIDGGLLRELAAALLPVCRRHRAPLLINGRVDVALAVGADGVHLPSDSFRVAEARHLLGPERLIGVSTHAPDEVASAAAEGADYVAFGPLYETASKVRFGPPQGIDRLRRATAAASLPVLAIGGITPERVADVLAAGAAGIAVISAILASDDPEASARKFQLA